MTLAQIMAVVGLLLAFGVPQDKVNEVQAIMQHNQVQQTVPTAGGIITVMLKPAYTEDQLLALFYKNTNGVNGAFTPERYWPISVVTTDTTANISLEGFGGLQGEVSYAGQTVLDKDGNINPISYEGETFPPHSRSWVQVQNLTSKTTYEYSFTWKEEGREDTIITKTFKTK